MSTDISLWPLILLLWWVEQLDAGDARPSDADIDHETGDDQQSNKNMVPHAHEWAGMLASDVKCTVK